ncbi:MAG TPA: NAD(P)-dependent oxidoreductase [Streptosporangiaceae bacterium]|jgi:UDP-glucose 4-epimerase|nr:NAD(P)-dependent oxidoreductase [Streptosporangiaceae bacterium]
MILVTGGLGFVGSHTVAALLSLGEPCVLVQRRPPVLPTALAEHEGTQVFAERADLADLTALLDIGTRHKITGIVHLAGSVPWPPGAAPPVAGARQAIGTLLNVLQAACEWQLPRVGVASTIGVYGGVATEHPLSEDMPLPMAGGHVIPAFKKVGELLAGYLAGATGIEVISYRISPWGPGGNPASPFTAAPQLVHAAARGVAPDFSALRGPVYAGDGFDMCYVKDCARAIALLQLAPRLNHSTYNIGSGRVLTNREVAAAVRDLVPGAQADLPEGPGPAGAGHGLRLDIGRLRADTGYQPGYDTHRAVADYLAWLRAGHER